MFEISTGEPPTPPVNTSEPSANLGQNPMSNRKGSLRGFEDSGRVPSDFEDSVELEQSCRLASKMTTTSDHRGRTQSDLEDSGRVPSDFEDSGRMASGSLNAQEPDSGYEASPCSIADTARDDLHFFGREPQQGQNPELSVDDVFEDFVLLEPEGEEEDCRDCGSTSPCRCPNSRPQSSSATMEGELSSNCDSSDSAASLPPPHPSSLPIRIPILDPRIRSNMATNSRPVSRSRGAMLVPSPPVFPYHPRSCPAAWLLAQPGPLERMTSHMERLSRRASLQYQRRRRMQIDSDAASDVETSDDNFLSDDGLEDEVFPMAAEEEEDPHRLDPHRLVLLPDVVIHSSSTSSSSSSVRRSRSVSINLPPEPELLQNIGRSLRRLSEEFELRREAGHARRRQTISSIESFYRAS